MGQCFSSPVPPVTFSITIACCKSTSTKDYPDGADDVDDDGEVEMQTDDASTV